MTTKDYYKTLELTEEDKKLQGEEFIKKAKANYRNLCKRYHPDKYANKSEAERKEAEEKFKEITEAYDALTDQRKKQQYDSYGSYDGSFNWEGFGSTGMDDIDEMLNRFRSGAFGHFGGGFGFDIGGMGRQPDSQKPQPLKLKLHLSIEEIYNGSSKKVRYKRMVPCTHCDGKGLGEDGKIEVCPTCGGTGQVVHSVQRGPWSVMQEIRPCTACNGTGKVVTNPCRHCNGTGRVVSTDEIEIQIPAGATDGFTFVIPGKGNYAERNKNIVGDMMILVVVDPNNKFGIANQYDLYKPIEVPILDCITGTKVDIQLPNGKKVAIDVPKFCKEGKILKVNNLGMPIGNGGRGSLLIEIKHKFPKDISRSEEKLLGELKNSRNFKL